MWVLLPALFMGWALGANAAANVCALGIATGAWRYRTAVLLTAAFSVLGAYLAGRAGMNTYGNLASHELGSAFCATLAAGLIVAVMSWRGLPVPGPQAIVGAIVGVALAAGRSVQWSLFGKIIASWVINPISACVLAYLLSRILTPLLSRKLLGLEAFDRLTRAILVLVGLWGQGFWLRRTGFGCKLSLGGVGERPKPPAWRAGAPQKGAAGSNPAPSARPVQGGGLAVP